MKNPNSNKQYQFADTDSDMDDGELTDEDDRRHGAKQNINSHFGDDAKYLRGTQVMGNVLNIDQQQQKQRGQQQYQDYLTRQQLDAQKAAEDKKLKLELALKEKLR